MAVKSSGQLAISEIVAEFGGSAPHAISEYYGGAGLVPQGANSGVPTSGEIQMIFLKHRHWFHRPRRGFFPS